MRFADIRGNEELCRALSGMVSSGRIPHAIMLHEDDGGGGVAIALAFLQMLFCSARSGEDSCAECPSCSKISKFIHPDIYFVCPVSGGETSEAFAQKWRELIVSKPSFTAQELGEALGLETKNSIISVKESRAILEKLSLSALEGGYRAVLMYLPEKMNQEAANSLLKAIEEPEPMTQFVLVTHAPEMVLPTIASRCQRLRVLPAGARSVSNDVFEGLLSSMMDSFRAGNLSSALDLAEDMASLPSRENAKAFCSYVSERLRQVFLLRQKMENLVPEVDEKLRRWAAECKPAFPRTALASLGRAIYLIDRNVNLKILFTDLICNLYKEYGK